jgi:hypothetical protein
MSGDNSHTLALWDPPSAGPELPEELVPRASVLLSRQADVVRRLEDIRLGALRQLRLLNLDATKGLGGGPRFIDHRA